jgi:flagellin-specific chaperone FliS
MKANKLMMPLLLATAMAGCNQNKDKPDHVERGSDQVSMEAIIADTREDMKGQITDLKAESFNALVPNSRVREMARGFFGRPLKAGPQTWAAHEFAYTGIVHPEVYDRLPEGVYRESDGALNKLLMEARSEVMEKAKAHLSQPDNLMAFYQSKKAIILDELNESLEYNGGADKEERLKKLKEWAAGLEEAVKALEKPEFDSAYQNYLEAEKALTESRPDFASEFGGISEEVRFGHSKKVDENRRKAIPAYAKFREAEEALKKLTPDLMATLFAARRRNENPEILKTYLVILEDLQSEMEAIQ